MRRERRVDGAGLRRSRVGRNAIAAIARIETLNHTCCCASISFHRVGIVSKCAYAPRPSSSRGGLLADCPPPHGLLAARAALPVQHAATTASPSIALRSSVQCAACAAQLLMRFVTPNSTRVLCRCFLWVCGAGRPLLCRVPSKAQLARLLVSYSASCFGASFWGQGSRRPLGGRIGRLHSSGITD